MSEKNDPFVEPVQIAYARLLGVAVLAGFVFLFAGFVLYSAGVPASGTPIDEVPELWHLSAEEFAERTSRELGWRWVRDIGQGDLLAFAAVVYFPSATLVVILIGGLLFARHKNTSYAIIAVLEAVVLLVAATGVLGG